MHRPASSLHSFRTCPTKKRVSNLCKRARWEPRWRAHLIQALLGLGVGPLEVLPQLVQLRRSHHALLGGHQVRVCLGAGTQLGPDALGVLERLHRGALHLGVQVGRQLLHHVLRQRMLGVADLRAGTAPVSGAAFCAASGHRSRRGRDDGSVPRRPARGRPPPRGTAAPRRARRSAWSSCP